MRARFLVGALPLAMLLGCATYHDDLVRGERAFEDNQHEQALAIFRGLERDTSHLDPPERARYYYLRGMTDYRIGYKADARHWLMLAQAAETAMPGTLPDDWKQRMGDAVKELDGQTYDDGFASLSSTAKKDGDAKDESSGAAPKAKSEDVP